MDDRFFRAKPAKSAKSSMKQNFAYFAILENAFWMQFWSVNCRGQVLFS